MRSRGARLLARCSVRSVAAIAIVCLTWTALPAAAHADVSADPEVVDPVSKGQVCGLTQIDYTSTNGPAKLALEVSKGVATEVSTSMAVDAQVVSAGVGFSVTQSVTVANKIEIEVAAGEFGEIYAFPMFEVISFSIVGTSRGSGYVMKPVGVCFSPIRS